VLLVDPAVCRMGGPSKAFSSPKLYFEFFFFAIDASPRICQSCQLPVANQVQSHITASHSFRCQSWLQELGARVSLQSVEPSWLRPIAIRVPAAGLF